MKERDFVQTLPAMRLPFRMLFDAVVAVALLGALLQQRFVWFEFGLWLLALFYFVVHFVWLLAGHEVVIVQGGTVRIEARIAGRRIRHRDFELSRVRRLRRYRCWFWIPVSATGLPKRFAHLDPEVWFVYDGVDYGFGDALDASAADDLVARLGALGVHRDA